MPKPPPSPPSQPGWSRWDSVKVVLVVVLGVALLTMDRPTGLPVQAGNMQLPGFDGLSEAQGDAADASLAECVPDPGAVDRDSLTAPTHPKALALSAARRDAFALPAGLVPGEEGCEGSSPRTPHPPGPENPRR